VWRVSDAQTRLGGAAMLMSIRSLIWLHGCTLTIGVAMWIDPLWRTGRLGGFRIQQIVGECGVKRRIISIHTPNIRDIPRVVR